MNLKPPADGAYLNEADLPAIKGTFWRHNIVAFAPFLPVTAAASFAGHTQQIELVGTWFAHPFRYGPENFSTGVEATNPWWKVEGKWPADDSNDVLVGEALAARTGAHVGDAISVAGRELKVAGILTAGPAENQQIIAPLHVAQEIAGRPGAVRRVMVSALTKPEDDLARRAALAADPRKALSPELYDRWYCSPYVSSIAYQLVEVHPALARRADPPGGAERGRGARAHQGTDAADHAGRAAGFGAGGLGGHGNRHLRAPARSGIDEGAGRGRSLGGRTVLH